MDGSLMQRLPVCFTCDNPVEYDPLFEAPCGHDQHPSAVFHPLCLMEWREMVAEARMRWEEIRRHMEEHHEHDIT